MVAYLTRATRYQDFNKRYLSIHDLQGRYRAFFAALFFPQLAVQVAFLIS